MIDIKLPKDFKSINLRLEKQHNMPVDPMLDTFRLTGLLETYGRTPVNMTLLIQGSENLNVVGMYSEDMIRKMLTKDEVNVKSVGSIFAPNVPDILKNLYNEGVSPLDSSGRLVVPQLDEALQDSLNPTKKIQLRRREDLPGFDISPTHAVDYYAQAEVDNLKKENEILKQEIADLHRLLNATPAGDIAFGRGFAKMSMKDIREDIQDRKARYEDQGLSMKRFVYLPYEPLYIGTILGIEVFSGMSFDDRILTLEDLRKATAKFKEMVVGVDVGKGR